MMRTGFSATLLLLAGLIVPAGSGACAEPAATAAPIVARAPHRVRVYGGSTGPGPNSVRVCNAHYEQEHRPSGTVIVPRMNCYWRG